MVSDELRVAFDGLPHTMHALEVEKNELQARVRSPAAAGAGCCLWCALPRDAD